MKRFTDLHLRYGARKDWLLVDDFHFQGDSRVWVVPAGFQTDLDSVPRIPGLYAMFKGRSVKAAIVHDWLYATQQGKLLADKVFLEAMKHEGLSRRHRWPIYLAVVLFGWSIYAGKTK